MAERGPATAPTTRKPLFWGIPRYIQGVIRLAMLYAAVQGVLNPISERINNYWANLLFIGIAAATADFVEARENRSWHRLLLGCILSEFVMGVVRLLFGGR